MKFPVAGAVPMFRMPPVMVPMAVFWTESKSSNRTAPGTELVIPGSMVNERAIAGLAASTHAPATSAVLNFDFMAVTPLDEPPQPPPAWLSQGSVVNSLRVHFFGQGGTLHQPDAAVTPSHLRFCIDANGHLINRK
jgi:hypothetical protein